MNGIEPRCCLSARLLSCIEEVEVSKIEHILYAFEMRLYDYREKIRLREYVDAY